MREPTNKPSENQRPFTKAAEYVPRACAKARISKPKRLEEAGTPASQAPLRCQEMAFPPSILKRVTCALAGCHTLYTCVIFVSFPPSTACHPHFTAEETEAFLNCLLYQASGCGQSGC